MMTQKEYEALMLAAKAAAPKILGQLGPTGQWTRKDAEHEALAAWVESGLPSTDLSVTRLVEVTKKSEAYRAERGTTDILLGTDREGEAVKVEDIGAITADAEPEGDIKGKWKWFKADYGTGETETRSDQTGFTDLALIRQLEGQVPGFEATPRTRMQAELLRLHWGEKVFPTQPKLLTKRTIYLVVTDKGDMRKEKIPRARKDLFEYHQLSKRGLSCPTCKRIAGFIRGVGQEEVANVIDRLLLEITTQRTR
jgi:hypothetical protein